MAHVIVEVDFPIPLTDEEHGRMGKLIDDCLAARSASWVRSYLSLDRRRMVCEFEAGDAEAIRESYRSAGVAFTRVWAAERYQRG